MISVPFQRDYLIQSFPGMTKEELEVRHHKKWLKNLEKLFFYLFRYRTSRTAHFIVNFKFQLQVISLYEFASSCCFIGNISTEYEKYHDARLDQHNSKLVHS